jgi:hypothetical protein
MPKDKMSVEKAKQLYKKAHRGLSAKEERAAHKAEKLLKKKKIKAKRNGKKFSFSDKKKLEEAKTVGKIRNAIRKRVNDASYKLSSMIAPGLTEPGLYDEPARLSTAILSRIKRPSGKRMKSPATIHKEELPF